MTTFFVPYQGNDPAAVQIKGHRLVILSAEAPDKLEELELLGATEYRPVEVNNNSESLALLAEEVGAGVVLSPPGVSIRVVISNLERELPWVQ